MDEALAMEHFSAPPISATRTRTRSSPSRTASDGCVPHLARRETRGAETLAPPRDVASLPNRSVLLSPPSPSPGPPRLRTPERSDASLLPPPPQGGVEKNTPLAVRISTSWPRRRRARQMALAHRHLRGAGVPTSCRAAVLYYEPAADTVVSSASDSRAARLRHVGEDPPDGGDGGRRCAPTRARRRAVLPVLGGFGQRGRRVRRRSTAQRRRQGHDQGPRPRVPVLHTGGGGGRRRRHVAPRAHARQRVGRQTEQRVGAGALRSRGGEGQQSRAVRPRVHASRRVRRAAEPRRGGEILPPRRGAGFRGRAVSSRRVARARCRRREGSREGVLQFQPRRAPGPRDGNL